MSLCMFLHDVFLVVNLVSVAALQASSLLQLFLRPTPISSGRHQQGPPRASGSGDPLASWAEAGDDQEGGWGGDDGYSNDGDDYDTGAEGYNAGAQCEACCYQCFLSRHSAPSAC
jgi:hypothetical protein